MSYSRSLFHAALVAAILTIPARAQVTPATGVTPPDDTPSFKIGATIFSDYTSQQSPVSTNAEGDRFHATSFNVGRAYINLTGSLNHRISFRITPDIARESGSGSSLSGSQTFRLKYAFGQLNLDDWTTKGSFVRLGLQQTPYVDFAESNYRYRFQGPIFVDREGFVGSSDAGLSARWAFPGNYGDVHGGFYNGEGYNKSETNNEKAFMIRGSVRPMPMGGTLLKGLTLTGFVDVDHYQAGAKRQRTVGAVMYTHPRVNAGVELLRATDRSSSSKPEVDAKGYSAWATPKIGGGFELLLRHDELKPDTDTDQKRKRNIAGVAYWVPNLNKVTAALLVDYDSLQQSGYSTERPDDTRYGVKMLINF